MSLFNIMVLFTLILLMLGFKLIIEHYCNILTNFLALKRVTNVNNTNNSSLVVGNDPLDIGEEFLQAGNNIKLYVKYAQIYCHGIELRKLIDRSLHRISLIFFLVKLTLERGRRVQDRLEMLHLNYQHYLPVSKVR